MVTVASLAALAIAGCDSSERQDAHAPSGTYRVDVSAHFPTTQRLARSSQMRIAVRNAGDEAIPNVSVTLSGRKGAPAALAFAEASRQIGLDDPSRPVWIIDHDPYGGKTASWNTWTLGRLAPGATKVFRWDVTAVRAGTHVVRYRVGADLVGKARAVLAGGGTPSGRFRVRIIRKAPVITVGDHGQIVTRPAKGAAAS